jgi:hypothetical protein
MSPSQPEPADAVPADGELHCALTGKVIVPSEAYWAPPLITAGELFSTIFQTARRAPANLGNVLFDEQPNVPYHPEARELLASRRTAEQLKLLAVLLLIAAIIIVPILLIVM